MLTVVCCVLCAVRDRERRRREWAAGNAEVLQRFRDPSSELFTIAVEHADEEAKASLPPDRPIAALATPLLDIVGPLANSKLLDQPRRNRRVRADGPWRAGGGAPADDSEQTSPTGAATGAAAAAAAAAGVTSAPGDAAGMSTASPTARKSSMASPLTTSRKGTARGGDGTSATATARGDQGASSGPASERGGAGGGGEGGGEGEAATGGVDDHASDVDSVTGEQHITDVVLDEDGREVITAITAETVRKKRAVAGDGQQPDGELDVVNAEPYHRSLALCCMSSSVWRAAVDAVTQMFTRRVPQLVLLPDVQRPADPDTADGEVPVAITLDKEFAYGGDQVVSSAATGGMQVRDVFHRYRLLDTTVRGVKGWACVSRHRVHRVDAVVVDCGGGVRDRHRVVGNLGALSSHCYSLRR